MKRLFYIVALFLVFMLPLHSGQALQIGVILPMQHKAMDEIVAGLQEELAPHLSPTDKIIVRNANGDPVLQRQIIQQMRMQGVDYFLPVGTATSLMTLSLIPSKPVICTAALILPDQLKAIQNKQVGVINDEIQVSHLLHFLKTHFPHLQKLGFIYSNSEKIFPEIKEAQVFCERQGLSFTSRKIDTIAEIYGQARSLVSEVEAVLVLKDHMVVSAISGISELAKKQDKLVIAMDDGSVQNGAHFGLGIREKDIGVAAAQKVIEALQGNLEKAFSVTPLTKLALFYNPRTFAGQHYITLQDLKEAAQKQKYTCLSMAPEEKGGK